MLDPKKIAEIDQAAAMLVETLPTMLHGLYKGCLEQGFTEPQAMSIVLKYLGSLAQAGKVEE